MEETPASWARVEVRRMRERSAAVGSWKRMAFVFWAWMRVCWAEGEGADIVEIADGQKTRINALGKERQEWSLSDFQSVGKP